MQRTPSASNTSAKCALFGLLGLLTGCLPADLENPEQYPPLGGGNGGGAPSCVTRAFKAANCNIPACHSSTAIAPAAAGLDLTGSGTALADKLIDKPAEHRDVVERDGGPPVVCNEGDLLINTANPAESWLLKKINGTHGTCGDAMPVGFTLSATDKQCIVDWIMSTGTGNGSGGSSGAGGSGGSGGSGGTGGTGGSTGGSGGSDGSAGGAGGSGGSGGGFGGSGGSGGSGGFGSF